MSVVEVGAEIGDYILLFRFPRGQGGEAWLVKEKHGEQKRILKLPNFDAESPVREIQRKGIEIEIRMLRLLQKHQLVPPVVHIFESGILKHPLGSEYPYIVMEYVTENFQNLEDHLRKAQAQGAVPALEMLVMFDIILTVIEETHRLNFVYNDLDIKHIYWDNNTLNSDHFSDINKRMRIIDWANAYQIDDPNTPREIGIASDINQAGLLLHTIFTYILPYDEREFDLPSDHQYYDVVRLANEARNRKFQSISEFRLRVRSLIDTRKRELTQQVDSSYKTSFQRILDIYNVEWSEEGLTEFSRRADLILSTLSALRVSYHHFFEYALTIEDWIRKQIYAQILNLLGQTTNREDWVSALKKYAGDLTGKDADKERLQLLADYIEQTYQRAYPSEDGFLSRRLIQAWRSLNEPRLNTSETDDIIRIIEGILHPELEPLAIQEWQVVSEQARVLEDLALSGRRTTIDTETALLPITALEMFDNAFVSMDPPLSRAYRNISQRLPSNDTLAGRMGRTLESFERLEKQPRTPTVDYRHKAALVGYCSSLTTLYNEYYDLRQFRLGDETHFRTWVQNLGQFAQKWQKYAEAEANNLTDFTDQIRRHLGQIQGAVDAIDLERAITELGELTKQAASWSAPLQQDFQRELSKFEALREGLTSNFWRFYTLDSDTRSQWDASERTFSALLNSNLNDASAQNKFWLIFKFDDNTYEIESVRRSIQPLFAAVYIRRLLDRVRDKQVLRDCVGRLPSGRLAASARDEIQRHNLKQVAHTLSNFNDVDNFLINPQAKSLRIYPLLAALSKARNELEGKTKEVPELLHTNVEWQRAPNTVALYDFAKQVAGSYQTIRGQIERLKAIRLTGIRQNDINEVDTIFGAIERASKPIGINREWYQSWRQQVRRFIDLQGDPKQQKTALRELLKTATSNNDPFLGQYQAKDLLLNNEIREQSRWKRQLLVQIAVSVTTLIIIIIGVAVAYFAISTGNANATATAIVAAQTQVRIAEETGTAVAASAATATESAQAAAAVVMATEQVQTATQSALETQLTLTALQMAAEQQIADKATQVQERLNATLTKQALDAAATIQAMPTAVPTIPPFTAHRHAEDEQEIPLYYDPYGRLKASSLPTDVTSLNILGSFSSSTQMLSVDFGGAAYWVDADRFEYNQSDLAELPVTPPRSATKNLLRKTTLLLQDPQNAGVYSDNTFRNADQAACTRSDQTGGYYNVAGRWELGGKSALNWNVPPPVTIETPDPLATDVQGEPIPPASTPQSEMSTLTLKCAEEANPSVFYVPLNLSVISSSPHFTDFGLPITDFTAGGGFTPIDSPQEFGVNMLVNVPSTGKKALLWLLLEYSSDTQSDENIHVNAYLQETRYDVAESLKVLPSTEGTLLTATTISPGDIVYTFELGISFAFENQSTSNPVLLFVNGEAFALDPAIWDAAGIPASDFVSANIEQVNLVASKYSDVYFDTVEFTDQTPDLR